MPPNLREAVCRLSERFHQAETEYEIVDHLDNDPDPDSLKFMQVNISESLVKLRDMGNQNELIARGEKLQNILKALGFIPESVLYILGRK